MSELKKCPFCGGEAKVIEDSMLICGHRYWRIIHNSNDCPITDAFGIFRSSAKYSTAEKAIAAWNRRADAAVEDLIKIAEYSGSLTCHCNEMLSIAKGWRGPQEAGKGEAE